MKYFMCVFLLLLATACTTKYNNIDTGIADGNFPGTMYEYLKAGSYDWDSTVLMIQRAGLEDLFEGKREGYDQITFFGPTNHSIRLWMLDNGYKTVSSIPSDICYDMIMRSVVKGVYRRDDIPRGTSGTTIPGTGGITFFGGIGNKFWIYSKQEAYQNVPESGAVYLYIESYSSKLKIDIASTNIETTTGVVQSLHYSYLMGTL